ncbi:hypothetical protein [Novosphingobium capsulatum]|uniref:hypothetical protein n=1 Tax=Novosphingobium capsulatum TaxID=13688 RepID=UPI000AED86D8|nr:hypothetical protein [Novosphingobium capsulatum]WQD92749.1 hypothetical protein U0041_17470 [Novosphingobium capsulatum]
MQPDLFKVPARVGLGNGNFLGDVALGIDRDEMVRRWKRGDYPDLHPELAKYAMGDRSPRSGGGQP